MQDMENESVKFETGANAGKGDPLSFIITDMAQNEHLRESSDLAQTIQDGLIEVHPGPNRGVQQANFAKKVKLGTSGGDLPALEQIKAGRLAADVGEDFPYAGWADADEVIRNNQDPSRPNFWPGRVRGAHLDLGLALAKQGHADEAAAEGLLALADYVPRTWILRRARDLDQALRARGEVREVKDFHQHYITARRGGEPKTDW